MEKMQAQTAAAALHAVARAQINAKGEMQQQQEAHPIAARQAEATLRSGPAVSLQLAQHPKA